MNIGQRLRELRLQKNLSFATIASRIGVTRSLLSLIEKDKAAPSIATLVKILSVLEIRMSDFFRNIERPTGVVLKKGERSFFQDTKTGMRFASLSRNFPSPRMEAYYTELEPGSSSEVFSSPKQVFLYVLRGRIEIGLGEETLVLSAGDSTYFDASAPHVYRNTGRKTAAMVTASNGAAGEQFNL